MKYCILLVLLNLTYYSLTAQQIQFVTNDSLEHTIYHKTDTTYMIHFFATWCIPCMNELPEIIAFNDSTKDARFKLILVSLDPINTATTNLQAIISKLNITSNIYVLNDANTNEWISKVDKNWSGAIPATLFINQHKKFRKFIAETVTFKSLSKILKK
ncbi:MAG: TlpA disulfide reductase family protein [Bacteroidota bacterium]